MKHASKALFIAALVFTASAFAEPKPKMTMDMKAEKEVVVVENGKQVKKRVEAKTQVAGETVIYTINYRNQGDGPATAVQFDNKIPASTSYLPNSSRGDHGADILFSIDNGKTYKKPAQLTYEATGPDGRKEIVSAPAEKYTDIRWVLPEIPAGNSGSISYEVRVK